MKSYPDRLISNLKYKSDILERIYESDERLRESININDSELEDYDDYLDEQEALMTELDESDAETDEIYAYFEDHPDIRESATSHQKTQIRDLISGINGKIEAVRDIESQVRNLTNDLLRNKREQIGSSRKNIRALQAYKTQY
ncbi:MAG: hypothetical protein K5673_03850 [Lachnospiraceae bacterium]|nr:hypothetical protein [Lachnospiraceae bacterium]